MEIQQNSSFLKTFEFGGKREPVVFINTTDIIEGVTCDVYDFVGDENKDLGIIKIDPGCSTPQQKIIHGEKTLEGYVSGKGKLIIIRKDGIKEIHNVGGSKSFVSFMQIGDVMQWQADKGSNLVVYEICYPPYEEGRFENI